MKRTELSAMEFFVLASVSRGGLRSLYELQQGVGLQPGAIHPVLRRLEVDGLLERSEQRRRRRRTMTVTREGERVLEDQWKSCLKSYPDVESILRAAAVAALMHDRREASAYLRGISQRYESDIPRAPENPRQGESRSAVEWYAFTRWNWEVKRRECAARIFREIAVELESSVGT
jgi:DNA-binding PadR family transcriptional regulator